MRPAHGIAVASFVALALLVLPAPARACGGDCKDDIQFLGWTRDSRVAAYQETLSCGPDEDAQDEEEDVGVHTVTLGVAIDGRTGEVRKYLLKLEGKPPRQEAAQYRALPPASGFAALKPLAPAKPADRSPDGSRKLLLLDGNWKDTHSRGKGVFVAAPELDKEGELLNQGPVAVTIAFQADGKTVLAREWESGDCTGYPAGSLSAYWSPDGRRVAFVSETRGCMGFQEWEVFVQTIGEPAGPSVQLLVDGAVSSDQITETREALAKAGVGFTAIGATRDPRTRTVVYFSKGNEQAAAAVAKAVPGGAGVEPLTWRSVFDLVLAIAAR